MTIIGLGLMGGSIARALRADGGGAEGWLVDGWSPSEGTRRAALESGAIDRIVTLVEALATTELLVLAAPPLACVELVDDIGRRRRRSPDARCTITDVASTKAEILARADALGLPFVGGHPMAGRETAGFGASSGELFLERPWVMVRGRAASDADVERVRSLALACGARPLELDADAHDAAVAAISHLPLVLSTMLVEAVSGRPDRPSPPDWPLAASLAASGWRDMTRLAKGDPAMGAGIAATNARALGERLRAMREVLDEWIELVDGDGRRADAAHIQERFAAAAARVSEAGAVPATEEAGS